MRFTIVTPSFNQAEYLEETITSVLSQSYDDLEYIVIDGGSTDGSVDIIRKYEGQLKYWCSAKDNGQSDAINKGFRLATGEIMGWINSDDYLEPNCLQTVARYFQKNETWLVLNGACNLVFCDSDGNVERKDIRNPTVNGNDAVLNWKANWFAQQSTFWRKSLWDRVGYLREDLHFTMDLDLWSRFCEHTQIQSVPETLANYRFHQSAKCVSQNTSASMEEFKLYVSRMKNRSDKPLLAIENQLRKLTSDVDSLQQQLREAKEEKYHAVAVAAMLTEELNAIRRSRLYRTCKIFVDILGRKK